MTFRMIVLAVLAAAALFQPRAPAAEETASESAGAAAQSALSARREALFERLLAEPDNLEVMFEYATLSIRLEDYEAAIATLERMLIYRQDLPRVRLELAVAYFNLGSYEASKLYFDQVLADPSTPETVRARVRRYKEAIVRRTRTSAFSVIANAGLTYATNATLGPDSDQFLINVGGVPTLGNLVAGRAEDDFGFRGDITVNHVYDLQQTDTDVWATDVSASTLRYFGSSRGDVDFARLRTGPRLSLDARQFGPKIRPYVEGIYLRSDDRGLFAGGGVGAEYVDSLSSSWSVYGDISLGYREFFGEFNDVIDQEDGYIAHGMAGAAYLPSRDTRLRATVLVEHTSASADFNSNTEIGLRLSGEYQYDSGVAWIDRKWRVSGYAEARGRFFEEPEPLIDPNTKRKDLDLRAGVSHVFAIRDGFGIELEVDALLRNSNIVNFDLDNVGVTLSAQYRM